MNEVSENIQLLLDDILLFTTKACWNQLYTHLFRPSAVKIYIRSQ